LANDGETRQAGTPGLYSPAQHSVNHRTERRSGSIIGLASWAPHRVAGPDRIRLRSEQRI